MTFGAVIENLDLVMTSIFAWLNQVIVALQSNFIFIILVGSLIFIFFIEKILDIVSAIRDSTDDEKGDLHD